MSKTALLMMSLVLALGSTQAAPKSPRALNSIGVSLGNLKNPFFYQMSKAIERRALQLSPAVKVNSMSADYDLERQKAQIEGFIRDRVDLIILNAVDSVKIAPVIQKARAAGVRVVAVDVGAEGGVDLTVTSNNVLAGRQACEHLVQLTAGRGNYVILNGPPVTAITDRVAGCKSVLAQYPQIRVISSRLNAGGARDGGALAMQKVLATGIKVSAVFAINDPTGIGAAQVLQSAGLGNIPLTAVDGAPDAQVMLGAKHSNFRATAAQFPFQMAYRAVDEGLRLVRGETLERNIVKIPTRLITQKNLKEYVGWQKLPRE